MMNPTRPHVTQWPRILGLGLVGLSGLLSFLLTSALPVVLDIRPVVLITGMLATVLLLASWRRRSSRFAKSAVLTLACSAFITAALAAYDLTLAYRTEEVTFTSGDVTLRGTLYLPRARGPHPGLILIHGSGRQPRREYRFYARMYARRGIAALAYDKRGSGESSGAVEAATYELLAGDAVEAVALLRRHPETDPARVGIWAVSEGEWVGALAAQVQPAFLVLISASAMTPAEQVRYETSANVRRAGFGEAAARDAADLYGRMLQFQRTGEGRDELNHRLQEAQAQPWFDAARYLEGSVPEYERVLALPWFQAWRVRMDFDALPILSHLTCPVLAQVGDADAKNDGPAALDRIRTALASGGNSKFTGVVYPNAAHDVIERRLPGRMPPPWFASGYLQTQVDWAARQSGLRNGAR